jgi:hypothetical protein
MPQYYRNETQRMHLLLQQYARRQHRHKIETNQTNFDLPKFANSSKYEVFFFASLPTRCHYTGKCKLQEGSSLDMVAQTKVLRKKKKT